jgi:hypothetical protein
MCEHIADQRHDRAERCLADDGVGAPIHLEEKRNGNDRTNGPANGGEDYVIETERSEDVAACHDEQASNPCARKFLGGRPGKTARSQFIDREPAQVQRRHPYRPFNGRN